MTDSCWLSHTVEMGPTVGVLLDRELTPSEGHPMPDVLRRVTRLSLVPEPGGSAAPNRRTMFLSAFRLPKADTSVFWCILLLESAELADQ